MWRALARRLMQTDLTVMISGESGTGKELVAKALHDYGKRKGGPFVAINIAAPFPKASSKTNCLAMKKKLSPAPPPKKGRFELADGGTLFLDEIGDLPIQVKLLRFLQEQRLERGGRSPGSSPSYARVVSATNCAQSEERLCSSAPFGRICSTASTSCRSVFHPCVSAPEDIPDLVRAFFQRGSAEGLPVKTFEPAAMERLRRYPWPGNVRELENLTRRLAALYPQDVIGEGLIEAELSVGASPLFPAAGGAETMRRKRVAPVAGSDRRRRVRRRHGARRRRPLPLVWRREPSGRALSPRRCTISKRP